MQNRSYLALVLIPLLGVAATGQQPPPTFRSGVQLVEVDARVFDKDGKFVADLTKDDFEVLEDGTPQRIDAMYLVSGPPRAAGPEKAVPPEPPAPVQPSPVAAQTWIFFFDLEHLVPGSGFDRARKAVEDFIGQRFKEGDLAGILAGDRMVGNRLTSVRVELLENLKSVNPRADRRNMFNELTREWPRFVDEEEAIRTARNDRDVLQRVIRRACADDPDLCRTGDPEAFVRGKAIRFQQEIHRASGQTLRSLNGLASGLSKIPGPKPVVFLSDGFVVQDIETTLRSVVGQTARAGARVYAIDVRGLNRFGRPGMTDQMLADDPYGAVTTFDNLADGPNSLAIDTGGLMIRNENNIGRALDRVADDAGRYYVLAYQPTNTTFDGKYRPIQVRVTRDGLRVRARKGYLALDPARMTVPQPIKR
ncbi:MAG: VWA domain-containing protein [Vicinamibacterales bacterium]